MTNVWPSKLSSIMKIIVSTCRLLDFLRKVADFWRQSSEDFFVSRVTCLNIQHRRQNHWIQNLHICLRLGSHKAWTLAITSAVTLSASIPDQDGDNKGWWSSDHDNHPDQYGDNKGNYQLIMIIKVATKITKIIMKLTFAKITLLDSDHCQNHGDSA